MKHGIVVVGWGQTTYRHRPGTICVCRLFATTVSQLKMNDFQEKRLKVLKCYTFLWVQRRHNCSPAASFANCVMILYLLKVHLQTFLSLPVTQKCQILSCDPLVANERDIYIYIYIYIYICLALVYISSVKTRTLTQLPDRKEFTRNESATDVDVWTFCCVMTLQDTSIPLTHYQWSSSVRT